MILWKVKLWSDLTLGEFWSKPIYSCPTCMASVHGLFPYWIVSLCLFEFGWMMIAGWIFYTFALSGLVTLINR